MGQQNLTLDHLSTFEGQLQKLKMEKVEWAEIIKVEDRCAAFYISKMELKTVLDDIEKAKFE